MRFCAGSVRPAAATASAQRTSRFMRTDVSPFGNVFRPFVRPMNAIAAWTATVERMEAATMMFITWIMAAALGMPGMQNPAASQRFDYLVRADFFAGAAGDEARLAHVMDVCEQALAQNPNHAEAHVWHGAGLLVRAGRAFRHGDTA